MYFIQYNPLKEKLRSRTLSDREALPYMLVSSALVALTGTLAMTQQFNAWDGASCILSVGTSIAGVLYAYAKNGKNAGFDFIQKFIVLGWVVSCRCLLALIPLAVAVYAAAYFLNQATDETGWLDVVLIFCFELVLYQRIGRHIGDTTA